MARRSGPGRHDLQRVPQPPGGYQAMLPVSVHNTKRDIAPVAIADPYEPERRVRALARLDLLDRERRGGCIDEASYLVGREVERIFEVMRSIPGGGNWLEGIDGAVHIELKVMLGIERAFRVNSFLGWLLRHLGPRDTRLLWLVLGHDFTFAAAAIAFQRTGVRGLRYTIDRFRDALATLAEAKAARGRQRMP